MSAAAAKPAAAAAAAAVAEPNANFVKLKPLLKWSRTQMQFDPCSLGGKCRGGYYHQEHLIRDYLSGVRGQLCSVAIDPRATNEMHKEQLAQFEADVLSGWNRGGACYDVTGAYFRIGDKSYTLSRGLIQKYKAVKAELEYTHRSLISAASEAFDAKDVAVGPDGVWLPANDRALYSIIMRERATEISDDDEPSYVPDEPSPPAAAPAAGPLPSAGSKRLIEIGYSADEADSDEDDSDDDDDDEPSYSPRNVQSAAATAPAAAAAASASAVVEPLPSAGSKHKRDDDVKANGRAAKRPRVTFYDEVSCVELVESLATPPRGKIHRLCHHCNDEMSDWHRKNNAARAQKVLAAAKAKEADTSVEAAMANVSKAMDQLKAALAASNAAGASVSSSAPAPAAK